MACHKNMKRKNKYNKPLLETRKEVLALSESFGYSPSYFSNFQYLYSDIFKIFIKKHTSFKVAYLDFIVDYEKATYQLTCIVVYIVDTNASFSQVYKNTLAHNYYSSENSMVVAPQELLSFEDDSLAKFITTQSESMHKRVLRLQMYKSIVDYFLPKMKEINNYLDATYG